MLSRSLYVLTTTFILSVGVACLAHTTASAQTTASSPSIVEITATDFAFRAPDALASGWTTIQFTNEGNEAHFVFLSRLPDGKTVDDYEVDLSGAFNEAWVALRDGEVTQEQGLEMLFGSLPDWFPEIRFIGGPGFASPGMTTETTVHLEPGNYVLECYMKTEDGDVHYMEGMIRPITVTNEPSGAVQPTADVRVTLSNFAMVVEGDLTPGSHTVEVHVSENPEEGFGHSVHVARLDSDTAVDEVVRWMNWFSVDGLRTPAPAEFIGGTHMQIPIEQPQYFTIDLEPGRYLFISEATAHQGVFQEVWVE